MITLFIEVYQQFIHENELHSYAKNLLQHAQPLTGKHRMQNKIDVTVRTKQSRALVSSKGK